MAVRDCMPDATSSLHRAPTKRCHPSRTLPQHTGRSMCRNRADCADICVDGSGGFPTSKRTPRPPPTSMSGPQPLLCSVSSGPQQPQYSLGGPPPVPPLPNSGLPDSALLLSSSRALLQSPQRDQQRTPQVSESAPTDSWQSSATPPRQKTPICGLFRCFLPRRAHGTQRPSSETAAGWRWQTRSHMGTVLWDSASSAVVVAAETATTATVPSLQRYVDCTEDVQTVALLDIVAAPLLSTQVQRTQMAPSLDMSPVPAYSRHDSYQVPARAPFCCVCMLPLDYVPAPDTAQSVSGSATGSKIEQWWSWCRACKHVWDTQTTSASGPSTTTCAQSRAAPAGASTRTISEPDRDAVGHFTPPFLSRQYPRGSCINEQNTGNSSVFNDVPHTPRSDGFR